MDIPFESHSPGNEWLLCILNDIAPWCQHSYWFVFSKILLDPLFVGGYYWQSIMSMSAYRHNIPFWPNILFETNLKSQFEYNLWKVQIYEEGWNNRVLFTIPSIGIKLLFNMQILIVWLNSFWLILTL